ncbi:nucleoside recognition domain-containing protein [Anaerosinus massiliensis]|uniref:nucleoside recognition domain-containing protein n=1 Tax=Massilibacillus massiliensis TaxID=1806837 RepID=UPI000AEF9CEA|nr:nucleoside recognition domain-containing protein [Massilibacillus massiliensis]
MTDVEHKLTWRGWLSFLFIVISFSGVLAHAGAWSAIDFQTLIGAFGKIGDLGAFSGKGGTGAREGFLFGLTLIPTVMFALGLIRVVESLGALLAAEKLIRPILKPLMGVPGVTGLALVSSMTSSDVGSAMTKQLHDDGKLTDDERTIFVSYQYAASATLTNTIDCGAPLLGIALLPIGAILAIELFVKVLGANIVRLILARQTVKESDPQETNISMGGIA